MRPYWEAETEMKGVRDVRDDRTTRRDERIMVGWEGIWKVGVGASGKDLKDG